MASHPVPTSGLCTTLPGLRSLPGRDSPPWCPALATVFCVAAAPVTALSLHSSGRLCNDCRPPKRISALQGRDQPLVHCVCPASAQGTEHAPDMCLLKEYSGGRREAEEEAPRDDSVYIIPVSVSKGSNNAQKARPEWGQSLIHTGHTYIPHMLAHALPHVTDTHGPHVLCRCPHTHIIYTSPIHTNTIHTY